MFTNRALYEAVVELRQAQAENPRLLEAYLLALWALAEPHSQAPELDPQKFLELLTTAFTALAPAFDETWRAQYAAAPETLPGFAGWAATLRCQVVDLHEMAEQGQLENPYRYFGLSAPRGAYWFNFDPGTYLECATVGTFGGWEPTDATGRVALTENYKATTRTISAVSWEVFQKFLEMGQFYE